MTQPITSQQSLRTYLEILDMNPQGILLIDQSGKIKGANKIAAKELGYSPDEIEKLTIFEVNPFYSLISWRRMWKRLLEQKQIEEETELIAQNNVVFPVRTIAKLAEIGEEKICCCFIENLLETNRYRDLLSITSEISRIGSWEIDLLANQVILTESALKILDIQEMGVHYSSRDLFKWLKESVPKDEFQNLIQLTRSAIDKGAEFEAEFSLRLFNGQKKHFNIVAVVQFSENTASKLYGIVQDISTISARSEDMYMAQFTLDNALEMIFWIKSDASFSFINQAVCKNLGYSKSELMKLKVFDIAPKMVPEKLETRWQYARQLQSVERETHLLSKTGKIIPVAASLNYIQYQDEEYICAFVRNIENKKIRDELIQLSQIMLNQTSDMIMWINNEGYFLYANEICSTIMDWDTKNLGQYTLSDISPQLDQQDFDEYWQKLKEAKVLINEFWIPTGGERKALVENTTTFHTFNEKECACVVFRDITHKNQKEKELNKAFEKIKSLSAKLKEERTYLQEEVSYNHNFNTIITKSPRYKKILSQMAKVADTSSTVLLLGETGTGKELLARAIHNLSPRSDRAMVKVNCAALPENLIESELFGHVKGAFTGAYQQKIGRFELADGSTIFLDEIGELPLELQSKLLRVLQEGEFEQLGGNKTLKVDVRVVAATNRNLEKQVKEGKFREDLYYRLNVFPIYNIPLRERKEDIPPLIQHFLRKYNDITGRKITNIPQSAVDRLTKYEFPGNIRELENLIERAVILSNENTLNLDSVFPQLQKNKNLNQQQFPPLEELERQHIIEALNRTNWKVTGRQSASELLEINGKTLASRMRKLNIRREDFLKFS
ncbi:MAG: hypothetical protein DHS20C18_12220 [Saprospiraceae bacterium]|nr:MAG: hypothetical protein DHS20C18_12220 [Saprospiraceae bacterium]